MDAKEQESAVFKGVVKGALVVLGALLLVWCFWKTLSFLIPIGILAAITTYVTSTADPSHSGSYLHLFFVFILNAFLSFLVFFVTMPILSKVMFGIQYSDVREIHWSRRLAARSLIAGIASIMSAIYASGIYFFWVVAIKNDLSLSFVLVNIVLSCVFTAAVLYLQRKEEEKKTYLNKIKAQCAEAITLLQDGQLDEFSDELIDQIIGALNSAIQIKVDGFIDRGGALCQLGWIYQSIEKQKNISKAFDFYGKAEKEGSYHGCLQLGDANLFGIYGYDVNIDRAYNYFKKCLKILKAKNLKHFSHFDCVLFRLACIERNKKNKQYDPNLAFKKLSFLVDRESEWHKPAVEQLAEMHYLGEGCAVDYVKAFSLFTGCIHWDSGLWPSVDALKYLSEMCFYGKGADVDYKLAYKYAYISSVLFEQTNDILDLAEEKISDSEKSQILFQIWSLGGLPVDKSVACLLKAKEFGSIEAEIELASLMKNGSSKSVEKDQQAAFRILSDLSERGIPRALSKLGQFYEDGDVIEKDLLKANHLFEAAAEGGDSAALFLMGERYLKGLGVSKDTKKGIELLRKAVDFGNPLAMFCLGVFLTDDAEVQLQQEGIEMLERAANSGYEEALFICGYSYLYGNFPIQKNPSKAFSFFRRAYELGDVGAAYYLGICYDHGAGIEENKAIALSYYKKYLKHCDISDENYPVAVHNMAAAYWWGSSWVGKNPILAVEYYEQAGQMGHRPSQMALAYFYSQGVDNNLIERNPVRALAWLYVASRSGLDAAYEEMKPIKDSLTSEGIDKANKLADDLLDLIKNKLPTEVAT